jgi:hypothetical protein
MPGFLVERPHTHLIYTAVYSPFLVMWDAVLPIRGGTSLEELSAMRLIFTKHRTYAVPETQPGIPVQTYFPGVAWPEPLANAKVYETSGGPVLAIPEDALAKGPMQPSASRKRSLRSRDPS